MYILSYYTYKNKYTYYSLYISTHFLINNKNKLID